MSELQHQSFATSEALCESVATESKGSAVLAFSCGKDAIGSWLQMRRHFTRIVPVYLYLIPDLQFVSNSLAYFEDFFQTPIYRLPHPSLYRWINSAMWQPPERVRAIADANLPDFGFPDVWRMVREDFGLGDSVLTGVGVRSADSIVRRTSIMRHGPVNRRKGEFFPIYDWNKARLVKELRDSGVRLPVDYQWFGRSFDGVDARFLAPLKEHAPEDYARVLEWIPLADLDVFRRVVMHEN